MTENKLENKDYQKLVIEFSKEKPNKLCADCLGKDTSWASVNLGIFFCIHCSGEHRGLGSNISKVRSPTLDTWNQEQYNVKKIINIKKSQL
jgi:stromal membrane-associated protein